MRVREAIDRLTSTSGIGGWLDSSEESGRLVEPLLEALVDAKIFRLLLPTWLDGWQLDLPEFVTAMEALGMIDGSMAWCVAQGVGCSISAAYLEPEAARTVFGPPDSVVAWGPATSGSATVVQGGYRLSGHWRHASGIHHATWLGGRSQVLEPDGSPRMLPNGAPEILTLLFPVANASIVEIWNAMGLRATGTDAFSVDDLFVPREHAISFQEPSKRCDPAPLYAFPLVDFYPIGFASVVLGIGRATLDKLRTLVATKIPLHQSQPLRENAVVQALFARCAARLGAAHAYLVEAAGCAWRDAVEGNEVRVSSRRTMRLAASHAFTEAAAVTDIAYHAAGMDAIVVGNGFERALRDVRTGTQQYQGRDAHYESVGRDLLFDLDLEIR
jgi:alkylation response protein AidB-like acyl-CoA dehydrogenase